MKIILIVSVLLAVAQARSWTQLKNVAPYSHKTDKALNNERIIGGTEATTGQFPYQALVILNGFEVSAGALITPDKVLSNKKNLIGFVIYLDVILGVIKSNDENEVGRVSIRTNSYVRQEDGDLVILFLGQDVSGPNIAPIRLPAYSMTSMTFEGTVGQVSGWGLTSSEGTTASEILLYTDSTVMPNPECEAIYGSEIVHAGTLCTSTQGGTHGFCLSDVGAPLVFTEGDGQRTLIAVADFSSGFGCEAPDSVNFYIRITSYLNWLEINAGVTIRP